MVIVKGRFWAKVDKTPGYGPNGDCWLWTGCKSGRYGQFSVRRDDGSERMMQAHRVSFLLEHGHFPKDFCCHLCNEPLCVNPAHLEDNTPGGNSAYMVKCGRSASRERNAAAKLSQARADEIRRLYGTGNYSLKKLAAMFGVSKTLVAMVVHGEIWN